MNTTVINLRRPLTRGHNQEYVRVDRASVLGNPFHIGIDGTREQVVGKYLVWALGQLATNPAFRAAVLNCEGKGLLCWCKPLLCHADIVKEMADNKGMWT